MVERLWKSFWLFLIKLNIPLPCDLEIPFLYICPGENKMYIHSETSMLMTLAALFIITKNWKQFKFSPTGK